MGLLPLLLSACQNDSDASPGEVTVGEARALDEAAAMLDEQRMSATPVSGENDAPRPDATAR